MRNKLVETIAFIIIISGVLCCGYSFINHEFTTFLTGCGTFITGFAVFTLMKEEKKLK